MARYSTILAQLGNSYPLLPVSHQYQNNGTAGLLPHPSQIEIVAEIELRQILPGEAARPCLAAY